MSDSRSRYSSAPLQNMKRAPKRSRTPQPPRKVGDYQDAAMAPRSFSLLQVLLTIVLPLLFVVALLVRNVNLYIAFAAVSAGCLLLMWLMSAFVPNARLTLSFIHIAMILVALVAVWFSAPAAAPPPQDSTLNSQQGDLASIFSRDSSASMVVMAEQETQNQPAATEHPGSASAAQQRLQSFMQAWTIVDYQGMVDLSLPSWVSQQKDPKQAMFQIRANRSPINFEFTGVSGSDADNSRTVQMLVTISKNNGDPPLQYNMQVLMMRINDVWYVDPNSLTSQQRVEDPSAAAVPVVTVAPLVTSSPSLQLYYNPEGGAYYHVDRECKSLHPSYLPLQGMMLFSQLNDPEFAKLQPCSTCHAPSRGR